MSAPTAVIQNSGDTAVVNSGVAVLVTAQGNSLAGSVAFEELGQDGVTWEPLAVKRMWDGTMEQTHNFAGTFAGSWEGDTLGGTQVRVRALSGLSNPLSVWLIPLTQPVTGGGAPAAGVPTTAQDGSLVTVGSTTDAANTNPTTAGSLMAFLKGILSKFTAILPAALGSGVKAGAFLVTVATDQPPVNTGVSPVVSFAAGSAGGTAQGGTALDNVGAKSQHTLVVTATATLTGSVVLQGSHDNVNWATLATVTTPATGVSVANVSGQTYRYVRAFTPAALTGGTFGATVASSF